MSLSMVAAVAEQEDAAKPVRRNANILTKRAALKLNAWR
jgi:hypothetical protein